jgi:hypothetical protein
MFSADFVWKIFLSKKNSADIRTYIFILFLSDF